MRNLQQAFLMVMLLLLGGNSLFAQKKTISGTIVNEKSSPLIGVSVVEKGTKNSTLTDDNGYFRLSVSPSATLVFTSIGFATQEVSVGSNLTVNATLKEETKNLNEVVVTGFGESRAKRNLGYAVTQISGEDIRRSGLANPISALQGMVAGLQVSPNVGGPQASTRMLIRGSANLDPYGNQPLIVVDDIVMDDNLVVQNRGGEQDFGNILKDINPDDIESISVLKGGAVTALYGSRASNGVIMIRTKKGFSQKGLGVSLTQSFMFERAYKTVDLQNRFGAGWYANQWDRSIPDTLQIITGDPFYYSYGPEMTGQMFKDYTGVYRANNPGANDALDLYGTGVNRNTNLAISGGNDKTTFRFSYSNLDNTSATPNNSLGRNSFNFRATHRPVKGVLLDINTSYVESKTKNPALQGNNAVLYATSYGVPRNYDINYWKNNYVDTINGGLKEDISGGNNAFWGIYQNKIQQNEGNLRANFNMRADLASWLRFEGSASVSTFTTKYSAQLRGTGADFTGGNYKIRNTDVKQYRYRGSLSYIKKINDFDVLVQAGGELNRQNQNSFYAETDGLITPDFFRLSNTKGTLKYEEGKPNIQHMGSVFFQGSIGFRNYLTLNLYGRNDWNSTLVYNDGRGDYSYFYPGADLAFVFTDLFKLPTFFDFGKLRMSYAEVGGGTVPYRTNTGGYIAYGAYTDGAGNSVLRYGLESNTLPNQALKPVRNAKMEAGIEFKLLKNRAGIDFTVYQQDSKNQIQEFAVEATSGVSKALINGGKVRNSGIELTLYGTPVKGKDFSWDVLFNYTRNRNKILSLPFGASNAILDEGNGIYSVAVLGGDYGAIRAQYAYASYQAKDGSGNNVESALNGMPVVKFTEKSAFLGDPLISYVRAQAYNPGVGKEEQPIIGSTLPKFLGSIRNTFNYKRVSLSLFLDAKFGGDVYSSTYNYGSQTGMLAHTLFGRNKELGGLEYTSAMSADELPAGKRDNGILPVGVFAPGTTITAAGSADGQDHNVGGMSVAEAYKNGWIKPNAAPDHYDALYGWGSGIRQASMFESSWISVREISVGYDLPVSLASKLRMNNLRLAVTGRNLFFLYNNAPDHVNPDNLSSTSSGAFIENGGTPYFRQFGFTLNASF